MRVGLIGAGFISDFHARSLMALDHELVMVSDTVPDKAKQFGERWHCAWTANNKELLGQSLDLVAICTPIWFHMPVIEEALAAGHAVFCEKPLTRSADDSRKVCAMVRDLGKPFYVGYMKRSHPTMIQFREMVPKIGTPRSGLVRVYHTFPPGTSWAKLETGLRANPNPPIPRDGCLRVSTCHTIDQLIHCAGRVKRVLGGRFQHRPGCEGVECAAHGLLEMENGATVMLECGWSEIHGVGRRENGIDELLELRGDDGLATLYTMKWDEPERESPIAELWYEPSKTKTTYNAGPVDYFVEEYRLLEKAIAGEPTPLATPEDALRVDAVMDAIFKSAETGRNCDVEDEC